MIRKADDNKAVYLVRLPEELNVSGFDDMPRYGMTTASSRMTAVSNFVRRNKEDGAGVILSVLSDRYGGLEECAVVIPEVESEDGGRLSARERRIVDEYNVALELATRDGGRVRDYLWMAGDMLDKAQGRV